MCLHTEKVNELLVELHEGVCSGHAGRRFIGTPGHDTGILVAKVAK